MIQNNLNKDLERKIDLYVNGKLSAEEIDDLWAELIQDDYYLDYLKSVANLKAIIEDNRGSEAKAIANQARKYAGYVAAAAVVIIIGVLGVVNYSAVTTSPVSPLAEIGLDIVRSDVGVSKNVTNETVKEAIKLAANGKTFEAKKLLSDALEAEKSPSVIAELSLTLGSIQYNLGEYNDAVLSFEKVTAQTDINNTTLEKGYWLLGNAYFQLDELQKAQDAFQKAYDMDGQYSRISKSYINALASINK